MSCDAALSQKGLLLGTPAYMSPEQVDGETLTPASDLFSLGSVLYALCTGCVPFASESLSRLLYAIAEATPAPIASLNQHIPDEMVRVIERLHSKRPEDRFPSAAAVALARLCPKSDVVC